MGLTVAHVRGRPPPLTAYGWYAKLASSLPAKEVRPSRSCGFEPRTIRCYRSAGTDADRHKRYLLHALVASGKVRDVGESDPLWLHSSVA